MDILIVRLGEVGLGLMWGWLLARFGGNADRLLINGLLLICATLAVMAEVVFFSDWLSTGFFSGASVMALLLRLGWYRELEKRFHS